VRANKSSRAGHQHANRMMIFRQLHPSTFV
jgi:hypothetical protein